jgi:hypothetical protein
MLAQPDLTAGMSFLFSRKGVIAIHFDGGEDLV